MQLPNMLRVMILSSLAVVAWTASDVHAQHHDEDFYKHAVQSDKIALHHALLNMDEDTLNTYRKASTNSTHAKALAKSLAEKLDTMKRLSNKASSDNEVADNTYQDYKDALRKLHHDGHQLVHAMHRAGRGEHGTHGYETVSHDLEHFSEHHADLAERLHNQVSRGIEHIFDRARDNLEDKEMRAHQESALKRNSANVEAAQELPAAISSF